MQISKERIGKKIVDLAMEKSNNNERDNCGCGLSDRFEHDSYENEWTECKRKSDLANIIRSIFSLTLLAKCVFWINTSNTCSVQYTSRMYIHLCGACWDTA